LSNSVIDFVLEIRVFESDLKKNESS